MCEFTTGSKHQLGSPVGLPVRVEQRRSLHTTSVVTWADLTWSDSVNSPSALLVAAAAMAEAAKCHQCSVVL